MVNEESEEDEEEESLISEEDNGGYRMICRQLLELQTQPENLIFRN